jgi:hypothetical protein
MKKGVLLSIVASSLIYAGGDIAPVEPVQPQEVPQATTVAPAACDFWGQIGLRYEAYDDDVKGREFDDAENNRAILAVVLGVEKDLGYGFGLGAELAGGLYTDGEFEKLPGQDREKAEISQLFLTYKAGNTAIKAGRQALPKAVSPLAWSDRTLGVIDRSFNGVTVVNTDIANTTLVGAWIRSYVDETDDIKIGDKGIFMLGAINKPVDGTTISTSLYYAKDIAKDTDFKSAWGAVESQLGTANLGLQVAYSKLDGVDKTLGVAGYIGANYNGFDTKLTLAYINDGESPLNLGGTSGFWGETYYVFGGDADATLGKQKIARLDLGYSIEGAGRVYGGVAADKSDDRGTAVSARVGYKYDMKLFDSKIAAKVEYRYLKDFEDVNGDQAKKHRIRVEGIYKF